MKTNKKNVWSEDDFITLCNDLVPGRLYVTDKLTLLADDTYEYFQDECMEFDHRKTLPPQDKVKVWVKAWLEDHLDIDSLSDTIADELGGAIEAYADANKPEDPKAKMKRLSNEFAQLKTNFLSKLTPEEQAQLTN